MQNDPPVESHQSVGQEDKTAPLSPSSDQILTGKQEHCTTYTLLSKARMFVKGCANLDPLSLQISSGNLSATKSAMKSRS